MKLFDNGFSPFARKVRMVLDHKQLAVEVFDGLRKASREALAEVNGRLEVPALIDGEVTVINSADIVAYLEHRYPERPVYPSDPALRVKARAWERCADTVVDPIFVDISYWSWADRKDSMPAGMLEAAQRDMTKIYDAIERDLENREYLVGELSIADISLFPHLTAGKALGVPFSREKHPRVDGWMKRMKQTAIGAADLDRTRKYVETFDRHGLEREKIFWRGDRIEWLLARGFHRWFLDEIEAGRVLWPGLGVP